MRKLSYAAVFGAALAGALNAPAAHAQNITEVQISPPQIQMRLGDRTQVFATAYSQGGNVALGIQFRWNSTDTNVVRVIPDAQSPEIGTLVAVGPGAAVVAAIAGVGAGTRGFTTVTVSAPQQPQQAPIAIAPIVSDSILPAPTAAASLRAAARVEAQRFGSAAACASGAVIGNGLVVTSYQAIRGADRVTVALENGTSVQDPQVVSYNVASDVAILRIASPTSDSLPIASGVRDDQYAWAVSYPACQAVASTSRVRINGAGASLRHSGTFPESGTGAALVDHEGALVGVVNADRTVAAPYSRVQSALADARSNLRPSTVTDVGRAENHLYGSLIARSDVAGATARVTPLESWQWPSLGREGSLPMTLSGPMGRYQVDLLVSGAVRASTTVRVTPGETQQVSLAPPPVLAQTPVQQPAPAPTPPAPTPRPQPQAPVVKKGGSAAVPVIILLAGGGGAAAYFLTKKKAGGDTPVIPPVTTGGVSINIPNP